VANNYFTFCPCSEALCEAEFKGDGLVYLAEEISRQHNVQAVAYVLLNAF
jgi:GTP cyclohydrolase FolE2